MPKPDVFESEVVLPDADIAARSHTLMGFDAHYANVRDHLRLLLSAGELDTWNQDHFAGKLSLCHLVAEQSPLIIYHGDVGTGKTVTAECVANRLVAESRAEDSVLFKLGNRVRGTGKVRPSVWMHRRSEATCWSRLAVKMACFTLPTSITMPENLSCP